MLITSRARLELQQEYVLALEGLRVPPRRDQAGNGSPRHEELESYGSASLFMHSARRVRPHFVMDDHSAANVGEICRLLGGLPLGLELAATWVRAMPLSAIVNQIQQGLDFLAESAPDLAERHRSLNAVFDHSWRMLALAEQRVLRRLAVFRDGFDYAASVAVADATPHTLLSLVDQSWLRFSAMERYDLHPLIHQYLKERLADDAIEETHTRRQHMRYFAQMACRWDEQFWTGEQATVGRIMPLEFANMLVAWRTAVDAFDLAAMHDISKSFNPLGFRMGIRSHLMELCQEARAGLEKWLPAHPDRTSEAAGVLLQLRCFEAGSLVHLGRHIEARSAVEQILNWRQSVRSILAQPDAELDGLYWMLGKVEEAVRNHDAAEEAFRKSAAYGDAEGTHRGRLRAASSIRSLADLNCDRERYDAAEQYAKQAIALFEALGEARFRSDALRTLAQIAYARGEYARADQQFREILDIRRELRDRQGIVRNVHLCGDSAAALGRYHEAARFYEEALDRAEEAGIRAGVASARLGLARIALEDKRYRLAEDQLDRAQTYISQSLEPDIEGRILSCYGDVKLADRNLTSAADAFQAVVDRQPAFGRRSQVDAQCGLARVAIARRDSGEALDHCIAALRTAKQVDVAPAKLQALEVVAELLAHTGQPDLAARLLMQIRDHACAPQWLRRRASAVLAAADSATVRSPKHIADLDAIHRILLPLLEDARAGVQTRGGRLYLDVEPLLLR